MPDSMKIAVIIDALNRGGAERQALVSVAELQKLGHKSEMIVYYPHREYSELIENENIHLVQIEKSGFLRSGRILELLKYFKKTGFDIVHSFGGTASLYAALAAKMAKVPVVLGGYRGIYMEKGLMRLSQRFIDRLLNGWVVNSNAIARSMAKSLKIPPERFHVVYNGISPEKFESDLEKSQAKEKLGIPQDKPVVSIVGRLCSVKNHKLFFDSAHLVLQQFPQTYFLVVGDGALRSELKDYARQKGICQSISFLGNRPDISDILAATDVSVLTSNFEGFPNALIEAMSVQIPVVSTDYPGIEELITDGCEGLIAPRNNAEAMASKILRLLADPELSRRLGMSGAKMVKERLSPVVLAQNLVTIYEHYLNHHG